MCALPDPHPSPPGHRGRQANTAQSGGPDGVDEAIELRREIETHLAMLEEDAMNRNDGSPDGARTATQAAEERFGNAVEHFRQGLAELERGQRLLRRVAGAMVLIALFVAAAGVVMNAWIMVSIRNIVSDWALRATPVEPDWGIYRFDAILLELRVTTSLGLVRTNLRVSLQDWDQIRRTLGGDSRGHDARGVCGEAEWPVIELPTFPSSAMDGEPLVPVPGSTITCTAIRSFEATTQMAAGVHSESLVKALSAGTVVDCVPVPPCTLDER